MNKSKAENKKTSFSLLLQQNGRFQGVKTLINKNSRQSLKNEYNKNGLEKLIQ